MDLHMQYEIAIQRMVNLFIEFMKKIKAMNCLTLEKLIDDLNTFKDLIEKEMRTTPMIRKTYEIKIHTCQKNLKTAVKDVEALRCSLKEEISKFTEFKEETIIDIAKEESISRSIKEMAKKKMAEQTEKFEHELMNIWKEHENKMELLRTEIDSFGEKIKLINAENVTREKDLRTIRLQMQNKSIEVLVKYDRVIGSKHKLLEKLTIKNKALKEEQEELRARLIDQNELYIRLKEEQEKEIMIVFLERVKNFQQNHAAKIIQKMWRSYRERQLLKRKKKTKRK
ncbi:stress response protein NST1-like isoform X1 [Vespa crabro]|uniref:stress response protein NST1-like isoform X1 n=1 Tax=Vespa crabro TaxID=7445 RepID=UPI001F00ABC7|nr:stress response protein NST1-like isoform X1 [Vespa crabro]XP_046837778.1 stress response protein NST1-like isoform X1 [Vespa crabro]